MGIRRTTTLEVEGHAVGIAVTELIPGRWGWVVQVDGRHLCSSPSPELTYQAAYFAALSDLRKRYPYKSIGLNAGSFPPLDNQPGDLRPPH